MGRTWPKETPPPPHSIIEYSTQILLGLTYLSRFVLQLHLYKPQLAVFQIEFLLSIATRHGLPIKRAEGMVLIPVGNSEHVAHA